MNRIIIYLLCALFSAIISSCSKCKTTAEYNDPINAEHIYENSIHKFGDEFNKLTITSEDGYCLTSISHTCSMYSELYQLYTPNGNLKLIASGSQEACAINGYSVDYNEDGTVACVNYIGMLNDDSYRALSDSTSSVQIMKKWIENSSEKQEAIRFLICRNQEKVVTKVGNIDVPSGYKAKYYLCEWGPFWSHDIDGGVISFFVKLECQEKDGSYVDYLYVNDNLLAELAYWNGKFIKARTYNNMGALVNQYNDRNMNILDQTFYDYYSVTKWYVD